MVAKFMIGCVALYIIASIINYGYNTHKCNELAVIGKTHVEYVDKNSLMEESK